MTLAQLVLLMRSAAGPTTSDEGTIDDLLEMQALARRGGRRG